MNTCAGKGTRRPGSLMRHVVEPGTPLRRNSVYANGETSLIAIYRSGVKSRVFPSPCAKTSLERLQPAVAKLYDGYKPRLVKHQPGPIFTSRGALDGKLCFRCNEALPHLKMKCRLPFFKSKMPLIPSVDRFFIYRSRERSGVST